jgi:hypothetical protein
VVIVPHKLPRLLPVCLSRGVVGGYLGRDQGKLERHHPALKRAVRSGQISLTLAHIPKTAGGRPSSRVELPGRASTTQLLYLYSTRGLPRLLQEHSFQVNLITINIAQGSVAHSSDIHRTDTPNKPRVQLLSAGTFPALYNFSKDKRDSTDRTAFGRL